jgi:hypothetical protein
MVAGESRLQPASGTAGFSRLIVIAFAIWVLTHPARAEDIRATATVDAAKVLIGDHVSLRIEVRHPESFTATAPSNLAELVKPFEVVSAGSMETTRTEAGTVSTTTVVLTAFEAGRHPVPALPIEVRKDGQSHTVQTAAVEIEVQNVDVDTEQDIKDVKPPLEVPLSWKEAAPYILGALGTILLASLARYIWKKRRKGEKILPSAPPRPAHELALEALRELEAKRLWQCGQVKEYHSELTDIVRTYIERKYQTPAMEMTTEEILAPAVSSRWNDSLRRDLGEMLTLADFVKFAKMQPAPTDNERSLRLAYSFVETTRGSAAQAAPTEPATVTPAQETAS